MAFLLASRMVRAWLVVCGLLAAVVPVHAEGKECAMVLLHGKWSSTKYIAFFG